MLAATTSTTSRCTRGARDFGEGPAEARGLRASSGGGGEEGAAVPQAGPWGGVHGGVEGGVAGVLEGWGRCHLGGRGARHI